MQREEIIKIIKEYVNNLEKSGVIVESVYLFGSFAKGNSNQWSDIDVAIISPYFRLKYNEGRFMLWKIRRTIDARIEPHGFTPEDWSDNVNPMAYEIKKTGVRIL